MSNITARQYRILSDHMAIYQFMLDIYERDWRNGVAAPFLEYALSSDWMTKKYTHRNRIWFDGDQIVGFCFTESPATDIYFSLRPGYEGLTDEITAYAEENMPKENGKNRFILFEGQRALMDSAQKLGYQKTGESDDLLFDYRDTLDYKLPEGFRFTQIGEMDTAKCLLCCWKGFNHEAEEGAWDEDIEPGLHIACAPHATPERAVAVVNEQGDYVCYAGMWWTPQNSLAYMEPLCTVPEYRHKGLAAAALSELYRRMKPLGATHMTGGNNPFYSKIGYKKGIVWTYWEKP